MATSTLFGYTLEDQDGKLVITVHGAFAETAITHLREEMSKGRGANLIQRLSPLGPLRGLMTRVDQQESEHANLFDLEEAGELLTSDQILNQGIDQSLDAFSRELQQFKSGLDALKQNTSATTEHAKKEAGTV